MGAGSTGGNPDRDRGGRPGGIGKPKRGSGKKKKAAKGTKKGRAWK